MNITLNSYNFFVSLIWLLLSVYVNSWLPGASTLLFYINFIYIVLFFSVIVFNFNFLLFNKPVNKNNIYLTKPIFLIILLTSVSIVFFNIQEISKFNYLINILGFIVSILFFFVTLPRYFVRNPALVNKYILIIFYFTLFISTLGIGIMLAGIHPYQYKFTTASIFVHPNFAPPLYIIGMICSIYLYMVNFKELIFFQKSIIILSFIVIPVSILFTFSRNGIISMVIISLIFFILKFRSKVFYFLPFLIGGAYFFVKSFILAKGFESVYSRFLLLVPAINMMRDDFNRLLWGYGYSNNYEVYDKYKDIFNIVEENVKNPHNSFVSIILMFGVLTSAIVLLFILVNFIFGIYNYIRYKEVKTVSMPILFVILMISGMLSLGIFESQLLMTHFLNFQILILFCGFLYYYNTTKEIFVGSFKLGNNKN